MNPGPAVSGDLIDDWGAQWLSPVSPTAPCGPAAAACAAARLWPTARRRRGEAAPRLPARRESAGCRAKLDLTPS